MAVFLRSTCILGLEQPRMIRGCSATSASRVNWSHRASLSRSSASSGAGEAPDGKRHKNPIAPKRLAIGWSNLSRRRREEPLAARNTSSIRPCFFDSPRRSKTASSPLCPMLWSAAARARAAAWSRCCWRCSSRKRPSRLHKCAQGLRRVDQNFGSAIPFARQAAISVLAISIAMVIGPTPPGTGVIAPARAAASA